MKRRIMTKKAFSGGILHFEYEDENLSVKPWVYSMINLNGTYIRMDDVYVVPGDVLIIRNSGINCFKVTIDVTVYQGCYVSVTITIADHLPSIIYGKADRSCVSCP